MRTTSNQEIERNYAVFVDVVCDGKSYAEISSEYGFSRQRGSKIVAAVAKRIQHTGHSTSAMDASFCEGLTVMRGLADSWRGAAKRSLKSVLSDGE